MGWQSIVEDRFEEWGFKVDWVWMNRRTLFLVAWKGNEIRIHYVEWEQRYPPARAADVTEIFLELLGYLKRLDKWGKNFKGRDISFRWMVFRRLPEAQGRMLEEAGVEPFFFELNDDL